MKPDTDSFLSVPQEQGTGRAFGLAVCMHVLLMLILWYGVQWQNSPSAGVEVELWSEMPNERPVVSAPTPIEPAPALSRPPQPIFSMPPAQRADISLRDKQQTKRVPPKDGAPSAQLPTKLAPSKLDVQRERKAVLAQKEAQKQNQQKQQNTLKAQSEKEQQRARERLMREMKAFETERAKERAEHKREARLNNLRQNAQAADSAGRGAPAAGQTGTRAGSGGEGGPGYADKVRQRVKPNIVFDAQSVAGNPQAVVEVDCAPDGSILSVRLSRSSGNALWDSAVLRAVEKSDPMPRGEGSRAPRRFTITFQPKN